MRPGSCCVSTARQRRVDEAALVAARDPGHLAGAALDVFRYEPMH
jgi:phosphoglycerate dehydrogenase-like enzyme